MNKCQIKEPPFYQCCCNCKSHVEDFCHCTIDRGLRKKKVGCICSIHKGWICVGFVYMDDGHGPAHSGWPEHSCGCELYDAKEKAA